MQRFLMCFLVLAVIGGQMVSAYEEVRHQKLVEFCDATECPDSEADHSCFGLDSCDSSEEHGPQCPSESGEHHHHHGTCCAGGLVMARDSDALRLAVPIESRLGILFAQDKLPDGPVEPLDKPPLI